jgi:hypothetical protein
VQIDGLTSGEECRSEGSESFWGWNFGFGFSFLL